MMAAPMRAAARCRLSGAVWRWSSPRPYHPEPPGGDTHFGFQTVSEEEKGERVYRVFERVAQNYDVMNDSMSLGVHRLWKDKLLQLMDPTPGTQLLDVAGGTGDIAFRFVNYIGAQREKFTRHKLKSQQDLSWSEISRTYLQENSGSLWGSRAVICDINKEMLKVGKQKALKLGHSEGCGRSFCTGTGSVSALGHVPSVGRVPRCILSAGCGLSWVVGDAEELPFASDKFDVYTIAFGIRNVTHIEQALQEAYRVLKVGGRFLCLEFSQVNNPLLARLYDLYSFQVIPVLGEIIAGDWKSYQYLVESIRCFPPQEEFKAMIEEAGFCQVKYHNLTSGVVAVHSGFKL
ncbi:2-methoxy-6-polyprenyl-1,4-benzoquinol methylase, mitochondrial isoform X1 [Ascaphus truei]|uniref:2-methoxy-6-polyprenyl-1,4-benzoquinol methylase, mitochondrial isoform X1 n=1 Tax=Ascaphus truei TaxID=8439 RepID=UPI003F59D6F4